MVFTQALQVKKGITAIIGSGGKTSLMLALGRELSSAGFSVILCTSTRIYPPEGIPFTQEITRCVEGTICVGTPAQFGKIAAPKQPFTDLTQYADYVLVEADGSKHLPLKAHDVYEPVIPCGCGRVILVVGATGLGDDIYEVVHRPEIFLELTDSYVASPEAVALAMAKEDLGDCVFINQADLAPNLAMELKTMVPIPCCVGSVLKGEILC